MSGDIEWVRQSVDGDVTPVELDLTAARGFTVGPGDILVVVFPQWVGAPELEAHRQHLLDKLGDRFVLVSGDDVMLARVRDDQWGRPALDH